MDIKTTKILNQVAKDLNHDPKLVERIYREIFNYLRENCENTTNNVRVFGFGIFYTNNKENESNSRD